jgi:hypothetical protein
MLIIDAINIRVNNNPNANAQSREYSETYTTEIKKPTMLININDALSGETFHFFISGV